MKTFNLVVMTPNGKYFDDQIEILNIETPLGKMGVMAGHIPLVTTVNISTINLKKDGQVFYYAFGGGVLNIEFNKVILLANTIESPEEIDLNRALLAKERAEKNINDPNSDIERARISLLRAVTRINTKKTS